MGSVALSGLLWEALAILDFVIFPVTFYFARVREIVVDAAWLTLAKGKLAVCRTTSILGRNSRDRQIGQGGGGDSHGQSQEETRRERHHSF